ncbi:FecCD family ABC transporter permease [Lusitaniella coriacea]|uniref:FecCD family ABC transporter permease n=1 Tax=Lusitaniella coriacea TaxID=1983105 RepID=UPI003CF816EC
MKSYVLPNSKFKKVLLGLGLVLVVAMVTSVSYGEYAIAPLDVIKTLIGIETANPGDAFAIRTLRLPRTLVAFLAGVGLAMAGTLTQGITRNPLAAPSIIGVNAGASLAAVTVLVLLPNVPFSVLPFAAFGGALGVSLLIYLFAWQGGSSPLRLVLVGVGFSLIGGAFTSVIVTLGQINLASQALVWLAGSVYGRTWEQVIALFPWIAICGVLALCWARELNVLHLGDDTARGLGSWVEGQRGFLLLLAVALAGASVATAGTIGFVGLMAPHLSRQLVGSTYQEILPTAALMGGAIVVLADLLGRLLFAPIELPCGIITAIIGAPYFLYLLIRDRER